MPPGDEAPYTDPSHHSGQHGAGGGGSSGGVMGQGTDDPPKGETMHKVNSTATSTAVGSDQGQNGTQKKRDRSGTLGGEGHDHDEGFPVAGE